MCRGVGKVGGYKSASETVAYILYTTRCVYTDILKRRDGLNALTVAYIRMAAVLNVLSNAH